MFLIISFDCTYGYVGQCLTSFLRSAHISLFLSRPMNIPATTGSVVDTPALLWLTLGLYIIGGHIGFPLVLITTTLLKKSSRHPTFLNLCLAWILSSISFSILFYFNRVMPDSDQPEFWVCLLQASAVLVSPILCVIHIMSCLLFFSSSIFRVSY